MAPDPELDFTLTMSAPDRRALLDEATRLAAGLDSHLGSTTTRSVAEPQPFADLDADEVQVAFPDVHLLDRETLAAVGVELPVWMRDIEQHEDVYWIQFPLFLKHRADSGFSRLELEIRFAVEGQPNLQPRAHEIFPAKKFETLAEAYMAVDLRLDEDLRFALAGKVAAAAAAEVAGKAKSGAGFRAEFHYVVKKARIDHSGLGTPRVFWRIDGRGYLEEGSPAFVVIARVPKAAGKRVEVTVTAQASRAFNLLSAELREIITRLPERIVAFFKRGAPIGDQKVFTELLKR